MDFDVGMKKTLGRRRIPIRKIEMKRSRHVTFSKRRAGLFKKASELSAQCSSEVAVIVFSESGKAYSFGHPSAESVLQRYTLGSESNSPNSGALSACNNEEVIQWENRIGMMGLNELQLYANYLRKTRDFVAVKAASMASSSGYVADQSCDAEPVHGNQQSSSNDLNVQDCCFDDVNWEDIESYMAKSPLNSPDLQPSSSSCFDEDGFDLFTSLQDLQPSSSSCFEVDAEFERSLCGIQWEKDEDGFDLFTSLQDLLSN